ncbi:MAG: hypothetical protein QM759_03670 [Terricaulis sp.]
MGGKKRFLDPLKAHLSQKLDKAMKRLAADPALLAPLQAAEGATRR